MNDDDTCEIGERCDGARAVHTHHRKLRSQGGGDEPANTLRTCLDCHDFVHANPSEAYERGLLVHSWADPALVEVFGAQAKLEALWEEQNKSVVDDSWIHNYDTRGPAPAEGEVCSTCERRVPHKKKETTPKSKVWSTRVPLDEQAESFSELVDAAAEHHGLTSRPYHRYLVLLFGVTLLLQAQKGELPA